MTQTLSRRTALGLIAGGAAAAGGLGRIAAPRAQTSDLKGVVRYPLIQGAVAGRTDFELTLLAEALKAGAGTGSSEPLAPQPALFEASAFRREELVRSGQVELTWFAHRPSLEANAIRVDIPLYRGLLSRRIFLVRAGDKGLFEGVTHVEHLRGIRIGQGVGWADTEILTANGVRITTAIGHDNLIKMLAAGRIDAYPRGVNEVLLEHQAWQANPNRSVDFAIEPRLALYYPMPAFFYVTPSRPDLAERITAGLMTLVSDGRFSALWDEHFTHVVKELNLDDRHIIAMRNPRLPGGISIPDDRLWMQVG